MSEEIKEILDKLNKTADNPLFVICSSQKELDKIPKYTANFLSVNDRQAKLLLNYITNLQQKVEQLENIRKEAIKFLENEENIMDTYYKHDFRKYPDYDPFNAKDEEEVCCVELYGYNDLLNILNKGSEE